MLTVTGDNKYIRFLKLTYYLISKFSIHILSSLLYIGTFLIYIILLMQYNCLSIYQNTFSIFADYWTISPFFFFYFYREYHTNIFNKSNSYHFSIYHHIKNHIFNRKLIYLPLYFLPYRHPFLEPTLPLFLSNRWRCLQLTRSDSSSRFVLRIPSLTNPPVTLLPRA